MLTTLGMFPRANAATWSYLNIGAGKMLLHFLDYSNLKGRGANWMFKLYFIYTLSVFVFYWQKCFPPLFDPSEDWVAWGGRRDVRPPVSRGSATSRLPFRVCPWVGGPISFLLNIPLASLVPPHPSAWDNHVSEERRGEASRSRRLGNWRALK